MYLVLPQAFGTPNVQSLRLVRLAPPSHNGGTVVDRARAAVPQVREGGAFNVGDASGLPLKNRNDVRTMGE